MEVIIICSDMKCPRCEYEMAKIQACHYFCFQCGGHVDCSDVLEDWLVSIAMYVPTPKKNMEK